MRTSTTTTWLDHFRYISFRQKSLTTWGSKAKPNQKPPPSVQKSGSLKEKAFAYISKALLFFSPFFLLLLSFRATPRSKCGVASVYFTQTIRHIDSTIKHSRVAQAGARVTGVGDMFTSRKEQTDGSYMG